MIELTNVPEVLYNASHVMNSLYEENRFRFEVSEGRTKCFLTKLPEDSPWVHVRDDRGVALLHAKSLWSCWNTKCLLFGERERLCQNLLRLRCMSGQVTTVVITAILKMCVKRNGTG